MAHQDSQQMKKLRLKNDVYYFHLPLRTKTKLINTEKK